MFRKLVLPLAAAAGIVAQFVLPAEAAIGAGAFAPPAALVETSPVEQAQFVWGGRNYCWYNSAWRGPGWYWCGYAWRRGIGWGGAAGWHNWNHRNVRVEIATSTSTGPRFTVRQCTDRRIRVTARATVAATDPVMAVDIVPATAEVIGLEAMATTAEVIAAATIVGTSRRWWSPPLIIFAKIGRG